MDVQMQTRLDRYRNVDAKLMRIRRPTDPDEKWQDKMTDRRRIFKQKTE